ncbi:MAG: filamentous hemagglutinin N-terminal domain-containing protein [Succinivibrio sp.]|nr:filamentous hemagglutinin N-terminal domain-containing protein [Succinivibrio sp.]
MKPILTPIQAGALMLLSAAIVKADELPVFDRNIVGHSEATRSGKIMVVTSPDVHNVIKWKSFDVATDHEVHFYGGNYLNLVGGNRPSEIDGLVLGLENVTIVNPNGIRVGPNADLSAEQLTLSTAKVTDDIISTFGRRGEFVIQNRGEGPVTLIGRITAQNCRIEGGKVTIGDISSITYPQAGKLEVHSSVGRIDVGGPAGTDLSKTALKDDPAVINHTGEIGIYSKEQLESIYLKPDSKYFLINDIELGTISQPLDRGLGFSGHLDGAFNTINFQLRTEADAQKVRAGLFAKLEGAMIENLKINGDVQVANPGNDSSISVLAGEIANSTLKNIQIEQGSWYVPPTSTANIYAGGLAGIIDETSGRTEFENVLCSIDDSALPFSELPPNIKAGSLIGLYRGGVKQQGLVAGESSRVMVVGENLTSESFFDNFEQAATATPASSLSSFLTDDNGYYTHKRHLP